MVIIEYEQIQNFLKNGTFPSKLIVTKRGILFVDAVLPIGRRQQAIKSNKYYKFVYYFAIINELWKDNLT